MLAKFFSAIWGWADYRPKDWSNAPHTNAATPPSRRTRQTTALRF